jgi:hypothetical protein
MKFSLLFASIFVQAVLHKEFVGAKSDKLLGRPEARPAMADRVAAHYNQPGVCRSLR